MIDTLRRITHDPLGLVGLLLVVLIVCSAKIQAIFQVLSAKRAIVSGIVTDERTALELLELSQSRGEGPSAR